MKNTKVSREGHLFGVLRKALVLLVMSMSVIGVSAAGIVVGKWYAIGDVTISPMNDCNTVYRVKIEKETGKENHGPSFGIGIVNLTDTLWMTDSRLRIDGAQIYLNGDSYSAQQDLNPIVFYVTTVPERDGKYRATGSLPSWNASTTVTQVSSNAQIELGSTIKFNANFCAPSGSNISQSAVTYEWYCGETDDINDNTWVKLPDEEQNIDFTAVYDKRYIYCKANYPEPGNQSNIIELTSPVHYISNIVEPDFDVKIDGPIERLNSAEVECNRFNDVTLSIGNSTVDIISASLDSCGFTSDNFVSIPGVDLVSEPFTFNILSSRNFRVTATVSLPAYGGEKSFTIVRTISIRAVFSCDKGTTSQVLFFDDFGYFSGTTYTYEKEIYDATAPNGVSFETNNLGFADSLYYSNSTWYYDYDDEGNKVKLPATQSKMHDDIKYKGRQAKREWIADPSGFVQGHKFVMEDPMIRNVFGYYNDVDDSDTDENGNEIDHTFVPVRDCKAEQWSNHYVCWNTDGFRVEDGFYSILSTPMPADGYNDEQDYWDGADHTVSNPGGSKGAMLFVNCSDDSKDKVIYRRPFMLNSECTDVMVLFSTFVSNASIKEDNLPVNVRIDIKSASEQDETSPTYSERLIGSVASGDVIKRTPVGADKDNNLWSHISTSFKLEQAHHYIMEITNNNPGGTGNAGNDILLDDISVTVCYPNVELRTDAKKEEIKEDKTVYICGDNRDLTLIAFNNVGIAQYIDNPVYAFQYSKDNGTTWNFIDDTDDEHRFLGLKENQIQKDTVIRLSSADAKFVGEVMFRVIVGDSKETIEGVLAGTIDEVSCKHVYAIDDALKVVFRPMKANDAYFGCLDQEITINGYQSGRPEIKWLDSRREPLFVGDSIVSMDAAVKENIVFKIGKGILGAKDMTDTLYLVGIESTGCADTQKVSITKFKDVEYTLSALSKYCEFYDETDRPTNVVTATNVETSFDLDYVWTLKGSNLPDQYGNEYKLTESNPELFDHKLYVVGSAQGRCPVKDSVEFSVYRTFKLNVGIETTNKREVKYCLPSEGHTDVELKTEKVFAGAKPSYANENVTTYYWYRREEGSTTETLIGTTTEPKFSDKIESNNIYHYGVMAFDGVCYDHAGTTAQGAVIEDSATANIRKKLEFEFNADKTDLCVGESLNFDMHIKNSLVKDVNVTWSESGADGSTYTTTDTLISAKSHTPKNDGDFKLSRTMTVTVTDEICDNEVITASVDYNINIPISIKLESNADVHNGRLQHCIGADGTENFVTVKVKVLKGNPTEYKWSDGENAGLVSERKFIVTQSLDNLIAVEALDEICNKTGASVGTDVPNKDSLNIIAAKPIKLALTRDKDKICTGLDENFVLKIENAVVGTQEVLWYDGTDKVNTSTTNPSATFTYTALNTTNEKITKTMKVQATDSICASNTPESSVDYEVYVPIEISLTSDADKVNNRLQHCINLDNKNNFVTMTVKRIKGNPTEYKWSDGLYVGMVSERQFIVAPGMKNEIKVEAFDEICNLTSAAGTYQGTRDSLNVIAAKPITLDLTNDLADICTGSAETFNLKIGNSVSPTQKVEWYEDGTKVHETEDNPNVQYVYTVANTSSHKVVKTMTVQTIDSICGVSGNQLNKLTASVVYNVYVPVEFNLTSSAPGNRQCINSDANGKITITLNVEKGDPVKYFWDGVESKSKTETYDLVVGANTHTVVAYDEVCNLVEAHTGASSDITIDARKPIEISLARTSGRDISCLGERIVLTDYVNNLMPGEKTKVTWTFSGTTENKNYVVPESVVDNGSYSTTAFPPQVGQSSVYVTAVEDSPNPICPAVNSNVVDFTANLNTLISIAANDYAICQDSLSDDMTPVELTVKVIQGKPQFIHWSNGEVSQIDENENEASITVYPKVDMTYSAYASDTVCTASPTETTNTISVTQKVDIDLDVTSEKVQMTDSVRLNVTVTGIYNGDYTWYMSYPNDDKLGVTNVPSFAYQLSDPGDYGFYVTIDNGNCGTVHSDSVMVAVADYTIVPNVITPYNGNIKNDTFMDGYDVQIFDRYQQVIYSGTEGWDGTYRGKTAPAGTYFYVLKKKDGRTLKGTIEVYK